MHTLHLPTTGGRQARYDALHQQLAALLAGEQDRVANMANVAAALHSAFGWHWVGFYRVQGDQLVLGPFQGPIACTRIAHGRGVCGTAWAQAASVVVPDVEAFPGHIACSSLSRSEIVVPLFATDGRVAAVLDVDSAELNDFGGSDRVALEHLCRSLEQYLV